MKIDRGIVALVAGLLLATEALAQPALSIPATLAVPGPLVVIKATTTCPQVRWYAVDPGLTLIPPDLLKNSLTGLFVSSGNGTFRVLAYAGDGTGLTDPQICSVTVGNPAPPPPPPPTDPLAVALQAAYATDAGTAKASELQLVQALLPLMAAKVQIATNYTTAGDFYADLNARRLLMGIPTSDFTPEWAVVTSDLTAKWPAPQALDAPTRAAVAAEINHIATVLGSIQTRK